MNKVTITTVDNKEVQMDLTEWTTVGQTLANGRECETLSNGTDILVYDRFVNQGAYQAVCKMLADTYPALFAG